MPQDKYIHIKGSAVQPSYINIPNMPNFLSGEKEMPIIRRGTDAIFKIPARSQTCVSISFVAKRGDWAAAPTYQNLITNDLDKEIVFRIPANQTALMAADTYFYSVIETTPAEMPLNGFSTSIISEGTFSVIDSPVLRALPPTPEVTAPYSSVHQYWI